MKLFSKSKKITRAKGYYQKNKFWINLFAFFMVSFTFIGVARVATGAAPIGAGVSPNQDNINVLRQSPATRNFASTGNPDFNEAQYGCRIADLQGFAAAPVIVGSKWFGGLSSSEDICLREQLRTGKIDEADFIETGFQYNQGFNDYIQTASVVILDQRPASGRSYVEEKVYALGNIGEVSAQSSDVPYYYPGTGFSLLSPIQDFWGWSVNIVYGFLIVLIIIVAFGIMFRARLGGSTAITLQSAIPSIAMAMVLVPLSYAISGLAIDTITLGTNVVHQFVMGPGAPAREVYENRTTGTIDVEFLGQGITEYQDRGYFADDTRVTWYASWSNVDISQPTETLLTNSILFDNALASAINDIVGTISGLAQNGISVNLDDGVVIEKEENVLQSWIGDIINFFLQILLFFTGLRIFWLLLKKFLVLIIAPIFSPFVFATIAIPGTGLKNVMTYMKALFVCSLFFIITYGMILITLVFSAPSFQETIPNFSNSGYVPPLLGIETILGFITNDEGQIGDGDSTQAVTAFIMSILSAIIYLSIPKTLNDLDERMGTNKSPLVPIFNNTLESAKFSIAAGRNVANAPGQAYRAGRAGTGAVAGAPGALRDAYDRRVRGIEPGEYGSYRSNVRRRTSERRAELYQQAQNADTFGKKVRAQTRLALSGGAAGLSGSNISGAENPNEDVKIEAKVKWSGADVPGGFVQWSRAFFDEIVMEYESLHKDPKRSAEPIIISRLLSIELTIENGSFPTKLTPGNVTIMSVDTPDSGTAAKGVQSADTTKSISNGSDLFDIARNTNGLMKVYPSYSSGDGGFLTENGKKASIDLNIEITNPFELFGYNVNTGQYDLSRAKLKPSQGIAGTQIAFSFGPRKVSNPVRVGFNIIMGAN